MQISLSDLVVVNLQKERAIFMLLYIDQIASVVFFLPSAAAEVENAIGYLHQMQWVSEGEVTHDYRKLICMVTPNGIRVWDPNVVFHTDAAAAACFTKLFDRQPFEMANKVVEQLQVKYSFLHFFNKGNAVETLFPCGKSSIEERLPLK